MKIIPNDYNRLLHTKRVWKPDTFRSLMDENLIDGKDNTFIITRISSDIVYYYYPHATWTSPDTSFHRNISVILDRTKEIDETYP